MTYFKRLKYTLSVLCLCMTMSSCVYAQQGNVQKLHLQLLLPLHSTLLQPAALAVEAGVMAAMQADQENIFEVSNIATGDDASSVVKGYAAAKNADIVIGPLSRTHVEQIAQLPQVTVPTVALSLPDNHLQIIKPQNNVLTIGLSLEEEAQQIASWIEEMTGAGDVWVVMTKEDWQQRVAQSFVAEAKRYGRYTTLVILDVKKQRLLKKELIALRRQIKKIKPAALFLALNREQASQWQKEVSENVKQVMPTWGTSALNPFMPDRRNSETYPELNTVQFVDIPWLLTPHSAVVSQYPMPQGYWKMYPTSDQRRLYALGIDAYRLAKHIMTQQAGFEMEGVTGRLTVNMRQGGITYFQRQYHRAIFQHGIVEKWSSPM